MEPAEGNMRCPCMVDYLKSVLQELLPAWLSRKAAHVDVRPAEQQPPMRGQHRRQKSVRRGLSAAPSWERKKKRRRTFVCDFCTQHLVTN